MSSAGCGRRPVQEAGTTVAHQLVVEGREHEYLLYLPQRYDENRPMPLVLSHGGWGVQALQDERMSGLSTTGEQAGFLVAYVRGYADNPHPGRWTSFNTIGSVASSPAAPTCLAGSGTKRYCYTSCAARPRGCDLEGCDWTTCVNSTAVAVAVLDDIEAMLCVDVSREYATGQSNGGMFALRLGATLSTRLAAIAPISATFTYHHAGAPNSAVAVLACSGVRDTVIPVNATEGEIAISSEGWLYVPLNDVFQDWRRANNCTDRTARWVTPLDGTRDLFCWGFVDCDAPVVRCAWDGAHHYFGNNAVLNGQLVWNFLSQFSKPTHMGAGMSTSSLTIRNRTVSPTDTRPPSDQQALARAPNLAALPRDGFYGTICLRGDTALELSDYRLFQVCAPTCGAAGDCPPARPDAPGTVPTCLLPSLFSSNRSHCVLTCNLSMEASDNDAGNCSPGAVCVAGYLRHAATGICAWENAQVSYSPIDSDKNYA